MFCYNCGKEIPENSLYCPFCGTQVNVAVTGEPTAPVAEEPKADSEPVQEPVADSPEAEPVAEEPAEREMAPHAISSFIWALVANDLCFIPILGLIFSIIALTKSKRGRDIVAGNPDHYKCKGLLIAAKIIGIIDLVASIIAPLILFAYTSFFSKVFEMSDFSDIFTGFA